MDINNIEEYNKDCTKYNSYVPFRIDKSDVRIVCIGDIHGDSEVAIFYLLIGKCIKMVDNRTDKSVLFYDKYNVPKYYEWIGKDTHVVQIGDQVDKCRSATCEDIMNDEASDIKILDFYTKMDEKAKDEGGRVISLLGNHEIMNVQGNMRYVSELGKVEFAYLEKEKEKIKDINLDEHIKRPVIKDKTKNEIGSKMRKEAFNIENHMLSEYLGCTRMSVIIIGPILFVHGGITTEVIRKYPDIKLENINVVVRKWLLGKADEEMNKQMKGILSSDHIFWNRVFGKMEERMDNEEKICKDNLDEIFRMYEIEGMVIGHTPQMKKGINSVCDNKVWRIDIGASGAFDIFRNSRENKNKFDNIQILEIKVKDGRTFKKVKTLND